MRYPNIRYGNPTELNFYATGIPLPVLARRLRRDERTVKDWLTAKARVPWWVPEVLRLQQMEARDIMRQHMQHVSGYRAARQLAVVTPAGELEARRQDVKKPQPMTALRLDEFGTGPESKLEAHTG
ncbi:MAG: hypothetical protein V4476_19505 [Pseudomonadota bacterium]